MKTKQGSTVLRRFMLQIKALFR